MLGGYSDVRSVLLRRGPASRAFSGRTPHGSREVQYVFDALESAGVSSDGYAVTMNEDGDLLIVVED